MGVYTVSAVWEPIPVGTVIDRMTWPAHVTLASNFVVEVPGDDVVLAVSAADVAGQSIVVTFGGLEMFGPNRDIPVQLVMSEQAVRVHGRLADELEHVSGFSAELGAHWRDGYRPHVTLRPGVSTQLAPALRGVIVSRLEGRYATVVAAWVLPSPGPHLGDLSTD